MRRYTAIYIGATERHDREARQEISKLSLEKEHRYSDWKSAIIVSLNPADERVEMLEKISLKHNLRSFSKYTRNEFDRTDVEAGAHFLVGGGVVRADNDYIEAGDRLGMPFDFTNACPHCLAGADQVGGMVVKTRGPKKQPSSVIAGEVLLVNEAMIAPFRSNSDFDACMRAAVTKRERRPLTWFQFLSPFVLPRSHGGALLRDDIPNEEGEYGCTICDRGFWSLYGTRAEVTCDGIGQPIESLPPVMTTWERFGHAYQFQAHRRIAPPMPVVCREIALRLFDEMGDDRSFLVPIRLKQ